MINIGKNRDGLYYIDAEFTNMHLSLEDLQIICAEIFADIEPYFTGVPTCPHCGTREMLCGFNGVGCQSEKKGGEG